MNIRKEHAICFLVMSFVVACSNSSVQPSDAQATIEAQSTVIANLQETRTIQLTATPNIEVTAISNTETPKVEPTLNPTISQQTSGCDMPNWHIFPVNLYNQSDAAGWNRITVALIIVNQSPYWGAATTYLNAATIATEGGFEYAVDPAMSSAITGYFGFDRRIWPPGFALGGHVDQGTKNPFLIASFRVASTQKSFTMKVPLIQVLCFRDGQLLQDKAINLTVNLNKVVSFQNSAGSNSIITSPSVEAKTAFYADGIRFLSSKRDTIDVIGSNKKMEILRMLFEYTNANQGHAMPVKLSGYFIDKNFLIRHSLDGCNKAIEVGPAQKMQVELCLSISTEYDYQPEYLVIDGPIQVVYRMSDILNAK